MEKQKKYTITITTIRDCNYVNLLIVSFVICNCYYLLLEFVVRLFFASDYQPQPDDIPASSREQTSKGTIPAKVG